MSKIRTLVMLSLLSLLALTAHGQGLLPFKGSFFCKEANISLELDLYEESLEAPNLSFLGKLHGYMSGRGVYGTWLVTHCTIDKNVATIRLSNDMGSDSQTILLQQKSDSIYEYKTSGGNVIKKAEGRKLIKIADALTFRRIK